MEKYKRLCDKVDEMLEELSKSSLSDSNIERIRILAAILDSFEHREYMKLKTEYYETVLDEMEGSNSYNGGEYSGRRHRDSRGRYSRNDGDDMGDGRSMRRGGRSYDDGRRGVKNYDRYMDEKRSYRSGGKDSECKQRMLDALEEHLDALMEDVSEIGRDADCVEEKETLRRYADKMKRMFE